MARAHVRVLAACLAGSGLYARLQRAGRSGSVLNPCLPSAPGALSYFQTEPLAPDMSCND